MKILLIGDFSSLHKNLQDGLRELGHTCVLASSGDGWKSVSRDIDYGSTRKGIWGAIERRIKVFKAFYNIKDFDVVQFVGPFCIFHLPFLTKMLINRLRKNNRKIFLVAAGTDSFYLRNADVKMEYSPVNDYLRFDVGRKQHPYSSTYNVLFNQWFSKVVDGIIPIMYEYSVCYEGHNNLRSIIPIPLNIQKISMSVPSSSDPIIVFHGLTRPGFKGTRFVREAFDVLSEKYKGHAEFVIDGNLPLDQYLSLVDKTHIIVDQVNSYSGGMNAIYGLAMGKVVVGGNEGGHSDEGENVCPIVNVKPNVDSVCFGIEKAIDRVKSGSTYFTQSRDYAELRHDYLRIAQKYIDEWSK